jgi:hypothetical protein
MQFTIDKVSDVKVGQYGPSSKVQSGSDFYFVKEDATPLIGKTVEADVNEKTSQKTGNRYKVAKILKVIESAPAPAQQNGNGKITWDAYRAMAEAAHELATKLEPDEFTVHPDENSDMAVRVRADRAGARAAITNTCLIAYSNGKIFVREDDDEPIPF